MLESSETQLASVRDFDGLSKAEAIHPKRQAQLDFIDVKDGGNSLDIHGPLPSLDFASSLN